MNQLFASGGPRIGASASASILPMNIHSLFPLGLTGLISLLSKGLYETVKKSSILPSATTSMELEGSMLSEISQRKINTV